MGPSDPTTKDNVDRQRGKGVFAASIRALQRLNALGYGRDPGLVLDLVYNPQGPSLPPPQEALEADYRRELGSKFGVEFNHLFTLANMPIQRFGAMLMAKGTFATYLALLRDNHCEDNLDGVMCRHLMSVDWRGYVYDCDFNQMLDLPVSPGAPGHVRDFQIAALQGRPIIVGRHCFGCTAGAGSSCGGVTSAT